MTNYLTTTQAAYVLNINTNTLNALVYNGNIPHTYINNEIRFCPQILINWLNEGVQFDTNTDKLKTYITTKFPDSLKVLSKYNKKFREPKVVKGYSLHKIKSKKHGFIYYVRYFVDGKMLPSHWTTGTNDKSAADIFAVENRERIIEAYLEQSEINIYNILKSCYKKGSEFLQNDIDRGRILGAENRRSYYNHIKDVFIPFLTKKELRSKHLRNHTVRTIHDITPMLVADYQTYLLKEKKLNPQTINRYVRVINRIFQYLVVKGIAKESPVCKIDALSTKGQKKTKSIYDINIVRGVFDSVWRGAEVDYLRCLIIYTTGLRNSGIERIQMCDIIKDKNIYFLDVKETKTKNGYRRVPLHPFVYNRLSSYVERTGKTGYIFSKNGERVGSKYYDRANLALAKRLQKRLGVADIEAYLKSEYITFYSGRAFWKTLMNTHDLGEVEEYFMGHSVSTDVAKLYNHLNKQGREKLAKKAQEVFKILDKYIFSA